MKRPRFIIRMGIQYFGPGGAFDIIGEWYNEKWKASVYSHVKAQVFVKEWAGYNAEAILIPHLPEELTKQSYYGIKQALNYTLNGYPLAPARMKKLLAFFRSIYTDRRNLCLENDSYDKKLLEACAELEKRILFYKG